MASAYKTIACLYLKISNGQLREVPGRALPELVYADPHAAAAMLMNGRPVYFETGGEKLNLVRGLVLPLLGELRTK